MRSRCEQKRARADFVVDSGTTLLTMSSTSTVIRVSDFALPGLANESRPSLAGPERRLGLTLEDKR